MSDSRFKIKAEFTIYGQTYKWDASLNWFSMEGAIDRRITEFFLRSHDDAYAKYRQDAEEPIDADDFRAFDNDEASK